MPPEAIAKLNANVEDDTSGEVKTPGKRKNDMKWVVWEEELINYLSSLHNNVDVTLSYYEI